LARWRRKTLSSSVGDRRQRGHLAVDLVRQRTAAYGKGGGCPGCGYQGVVLLGVRVPVDPGAVVALAGEQFSRKGGGPVEPEISVRELSDASVPFSFDVHMMISCDDAPSLENALHRAFHKLRLNKTNPRKEFFRTDIEAIRKVVEEHHGEVQYVANAEALEYNQSMAMSDEDSEFVEAVYNAAEEESEPVADDQ